MTTYDLVKDGAVVASREFPDGAPPLAPNKGKWLPRLYQNDAYDPQTEVREGPVVQVQATRVKYTYTVRAKAGAELDSLVAEKDAAIEREFERRWTSHITFAVGGVDYQWHSDRDAVTNITGVLQAYREAAEIGVTLADPRVWTPVGGSPVTITRAEIIGLGLAIATRKDTLFVIKKAKQAEVAALTSAADILAYDPLAGWE